MALSDAQQDELYKWVKEVREVLFLGNTSGTPRENTVYRRVEEIQEVLYRGNEIGTPHEDTVYQRLVRVEDATDGTPPAAS